MPTVGSAKSAPTATMRACGRPSLSGIGGAFHARDDAGPRGPVLRSSRHPRRSRATGRRRHVLRPAIAAPVPAWAARRSNLPRETVWRWRFHRLRTALQRSGIPFLVVNRSSGALSRIPGSPTTKGGLGSPPTDLRTRGFGLPLAPIARTDEPRSIERDSKYRYRDSKSISR